MVSPVSTGSDKGDEPVESSESKLTFTLVSSQQRWRLNSSYMLNTNCSEVQRSSQMFISTFSLADPAANTVSLPY